MKPSPIKKNKFSKQWMREHVNDPFVQLAQKEGYRSRAAYKLLEIDAKDRLLKPGTVVVDWARPRAAGRRSRRPGWGAAEK